MRRSGVISFRLRRMMRRIRGGGGQLVHIVWEYRVKPDKQAAFEAHYSSKGSWVRLFRRSHEYRGTTLLQDADDSTRYLTIDVWTTLSVYDSFMDSIHEEYRTLDAACSELTVEERLLGRFEVR